jgi:predicted PurR-regulated permease PerM
MNESTSAFLSPLQRRLAAGAVTCLALSVAVAFIGGLFWLLGKFLATFSAALWPVIIAGLLSFLLHPVCAYLERYLRLPRIFAIGVLYLGVLSVCVLLALLLLPVVFHQFTAFVEALPSLWENTVRYLSGSLSNVAPGVLEKLGVSPASAPGPASGSGGVAASPANATAWSAAVLDTLKSLAGISLPALAKAGTQVQAFFMKVAGLAIVPVYLFYLLEMRRDFFADLRRESKFLPLSLCDDLTFLARQFTGILVAYFRGQFLIGIILGVLLALGFTVAGLKFGLLLGLGIGLLNMVPYLGTMLGLSVVLPLAYFQQGGGAGTLAACAAIFAAGTLLESLFLTPKIVGKTTSLHPMAVTFSVFFWGLALDGLLGMILAVPLTAFFVVFWRLLKTKYLPLLSPAVPR